MKKNPLLTEGLQLTTFGKIFLSLAGAWTLGRIVNAKIRGSKSQVEAIANAMASSRKYQEELKKPGATPEAVLQKLGVKNLCSQNFQKIFGVPWPL
jgi:hypothetical protein